MPQCKKCQQFGHTKAFCAHTPKCIKCGNKHETIQCRKTVNDKCANCQGEHTANYWKGCPIYKEKKLLLFLIQN